MNIVTVGDVHGHDTWKKAIYKSIDGEQVCLFDTTVDKLVFVGDYVDDYKLGNVDILHNLREIIQLKKDYPDNVILLMGNHDVAYLKGDMFISGFRPEMYPDLYQIFHENRHLFQLAFQHGDHIWTHAGIHVGWWNLYVEPVIDGKLETRFTQFLDKCENVADYLNLMYDFNYEPIFLISHYRGGKSKVGGPLWADKMETYTKPLPGYHQVVGHDPVPNIKTYSMKNKTYVTYVDCLGVNHEFYKINL